MSKQGFQEPVPKQGYHSKQGSQEQVPKQGFQEQVHGKVQCPSKIPKKGVQANLPGIGSQARFPRTGFQEQVPKKRLPRKGSQAKLPGTDLQARCPGTGFQAKSILFQRCHAHYSSFVRGHCCVFKCAHLKTEKRELQITS